MKNFVMRKESDRNIELVYNEFRRLYKPFILKKTDEAFNGRV